MSRETRGCCSCSCFISLAISAICIWLALRILKPTCSIEDFDVFTPQKLTTHVTVTSTTSKNNTIHYDLKLKNRNFNKGIYYDALHLTFYYKPNRSFPIGKTTIDPFYQGYRKSTHRIGDIEPSNTVHFGNAEAGVFTVELATEVRYKSLLWKTKRRSLVVGVDLEVNDQGSLIKGKGNKGIKLSSAASRRIVIGWFQMGGILGIFLFIHFV